MLASDTPGVVCDLVCWLGRSKGYAKGTRADDTVFSNDGKNEGDRKRVCEYRCKKDKRKKESVLGR